MTMLEGGGGRKSRSAQVALVVTPAVRVAMIRFQPAGWLRMPTALRTGKRGTWRECFLCPLGEAQRPVGPLSPRREAQPGTLRRYRL